MTWPAASVSRSTNWLEPAVAAGVQPDVELPTLIVISSVPPLAAFVTVKLDGGVAAVEAFFGPIAQLPLDTVTEAPAKACSGRNVRAQKIILAVTIKDAVIARSPGLGCDDEAIPFLSNLLFVFMFRLPGI